MTAELIVIVPTRSRPQSLPLVVQAWEDTHAFDDGAQLWFAPDQDDPAIDEYQAVFPPGHDGVRMGISPEWQPMVHKLDRVARAVVSWNPDLFAVGFAGDDHRPRTPHWVRAYLDALRVRGTGIVHGDDGYQTGNIPTEWAMTADIVRALDRMVPAPVQHLYCDNAIQDLGRLASCLTYLPDVLIEHMNPYAGKGKMDAQYRRVNSDAQYARDGLAYEMWKRTQLKCDVRTVQALMNGQTIPRV